MKPKLQYKINGKWYDARDVATVAGGEADEVSYAVVNGDSNHHVIEDTRHAFYCNCEGQCKGHKHGVIVP